MKLEFETLNLKKDKLNIILQSLERYKNEQNITLKDHMKSKYLDLGEYILPLKKIYLDQKYWIYLRDVLQEHPQKFEHVTIYELLLKLIKNGIVICPISKNVFLELMKQSRLDTRIATAKVIDLFSKGITIKPFFDRCGIELLHFFRQRMGNRELYPLESLVWNKVGFILGTMYPVSEAFVSPKDELAFQKSLIDLFWACNLEGMIKILGVKDNWPIHDWKGWATNLTQGKFDHENEFKTFEEVYCSELAGTLDALKEILADVCNYIFESETGKQVSKDSENKYSCVQEFKNLIFHGFRLGRLTTELPSIRIQAGIYATMRINKQRKYKPNDFYDFGHATAALPYCDYFFTEGSLKELITSKKLAFDSLYKCNVVSNENEVIHLLKAI